MTATDRATNQTTVPLYVVRDVLGPVLTITATVGTTATLDVSWSTTDAAGAGVQDYDVEYAVDDGAWTGWFTDTQTITGSLAGQAGHAYIFRVRATDHVSNTGVWAQTTVTTTLTRKYYYLADSPAVGGARVAMRDGDVDYGLPVFGRAGGKKEPQREAAVGWTRVRVVDPSRFRNHRPAGLGRRRQRGSVHRSRRCSG